VGSEISACQLPDLRPTDTTSCPFSSNAFFTADPTFPVPKSIAFMMYSPWVFTFNFPNSLLTCALSALVRPPHFALFKDYFGLWLPLPAMFSSKIRLISLTVAGFAISVHFVNQLERFLRAAGFHDVVTEIPD
jgi:hypothetical protein